MVSWSKVLNFVNISKPVVTKHMACAVSKPVDTLEPCRKPVYCGLTVYAPWTLILKFTFDGGGGVEGDEGEGNTQFRGGSA